MKNRVVVLSFEPGSAACTASPRWEPPRRAARASGLPAAASPPSPSPQTRGSCWAGLVQGIIHRRTSVHFGTHFGTQCTMIITANTTYFFLHIYINPKPYYIYIYILYIQSNFKRNRTALWWMIYSAVEGERKAQKWGRQTHTNLLLDIHIMNPE